VHSKSNVIPNTELSTKRTYHYLVTKKNTYSPHASFMFLGENNHHANKHN
jgi:hypothetical protein